jgi:hypothetical protein
VSTTVPSSAALDSARHHDHVGLGHQGRLAHRQGGVVGLAAGLRQHLHVRLAAGDPLRDVLQGIEAGRDLDAGAGVGQRPTPGEGGEQEEGGSQTHENDSQIC